MQTTHKIGPTSATGFASYLTSESGRGDYYAGHEDSDSDAPDGGLAGVGQSRWHGSPELLAGLGLSGEGSVSREDLLSLMSGVSPVDGSELRAAGGNGTRVAGIDLTFSAPKSVSALWAVSGRSERDRIERAHGRAVASTLARVERDVELVRTRQGGELRWERARSVLAAEFVHTSSRMTVDQEQGGVPDPQLHSHVVVLGAQRLDGRFAAVDSRELFRSARANGAWYRAELASELGALGLEVQGRTGRDRRYFELPGVPAELAERWSARSLDIQQAAARFRERYGRDPRAGELGSLTVATRGTKTSAPSVSVDAAWRAVGEEYGLSREQAQSLFTGIESSLAQSVTNEQTRDLARELLRDLTREHSMVSERDLHARAYELAAGVCEPAHADRVLDGLVRSGELIELQGGSWTTRELREREQATLTLAASRAQERAAPVTEQTLKEARRDAGRELGGSLSAEQREALETITGQGGVTILLGQAGTGKGVVLSAATSAWEEDGYDVIGTAIAGATAERLGAEAKMQRSLNTSALLAGVDSGRTHLGPDTVVVMDEAGMADTNRLAALVQATSERRSKLVLVGDQAQLSSIAAGGMFTELQHHVPTAELSEVHRAQHEWERDAWGQLRQGRAQEALASYQAHDRLHITDTREQAAERMVADWDTARQEHPEQRTVVLSDASNVELDRINALAQERRAQAGELGADRAQLPDRPYSLAAGDEVIFTAAFYPPGERRVENGTLAEVTNVDPQSEIAVQTRGAHEQTVHVDTAEFNDMRLAYAQHVYKAQGATVDRAFVLTGGWQADRERAYVALSRARERTDIYVSREDLGEQGVDAGAIERLGEAISASHAKQASITTPLAEPNPTHGVELHAGIEPEEPSGLGPGVGADPPPGADTGPTRELESTLSLGPEQRGEYERESEVGRVMREQQEHEHDRDRDLGHGVE
ncbi:MAG: TrwC relaxase [Solirubrobacterales bacterium]|nr:TrwC relaxase [Solirubrobacterales bacterium]